MLRLHTPCFLAQHPPTLRLLTLRLPTLHLPTLRLPILRLPTLHPRMLLHLAP